MGYRAAKSQLITMLQGNSSALSLYRPKEFGARLLHVKEGDAGEVLRSRSFWLESVSGATDSASVSATGRFRWSDLDINVYYEPYTNRSALDDVIMDDYKQISDRIMDEAQWNRPTSTIISFATGEGEIYPFSVDDVDNGGRILTVRVTMRYTEAT